MVRCHTDCNIYDAIMHHACCGKSFILTLLQGTRCRWVQGLLPIAWLLSFIILFVRGSFFNPICMVPCMVPCQVVNRTVLRVSVGERAAVGKDVRLLATLAPDQAFTLPLLRDEPGLICFQPAPGTSQPVCIAQLHPSIPLKAAITGLACKQGEEHHCCVKGSSSSLLRQHMQHEYACQ